MLRKVSNLLYSLQGDVLHCRDWLFIILHHSLVNKGFIIFAILSIILFSLFQIYSESGLLPYLIKIVVTLGVALFVFATSERFFYVSKNVIQFQHLVIDRGSIKICVDKLREQNLKDIESPQGALYLNSYFYFEGYKNELWRLGLEIIIIFYILIIASPLLLFLCIGIIFLTALWLFYFRLKEMPVFGVVMEVVQCVMQMYQKNSDECADFILDNTSPEMREMSTIYSVVKNKIQNT